MSAVELMCSASIERDIVEFFGEAFAKRTDQELRQVGLECEFIVVDHMGTAATRDAVQNVLAVLDSHGFRLTRDRWSADVVMGTRDIAEPSAGEETVSTELGYPTIEVTVPPARTLFDAREGLNRILNLIVRLFAAEDCLVLGYGIQPMTSPGRGLVSRSSRFLMYERLSRTRFVAGSVGAHLHLFTVTAATHCHIDVGLSEAVRALNVLNALAGVQIALTANSPIWRGCVDPRWKAVRELFYDKVYVAAEWPQGVPSGVARPFDDLRDYVGAVLDVRVPVVDRGHESFALVEYPLTAGDFLKAPTHRATNLRGDVVEIIPERSDIVSFAHLLEFDARLSPALGTVESRISCAQPPGGAVEVAALVLGIVENLREGEELVQSLSLAERRRLRIVGARHGLALPHGESSFYGLIGAVVALAERGLKQRKHGEEQLLRGVSVRLAGRKTHADDAIAAFTAQGVEGLLDLRAHHF